MPQSPRFFYIPLIAFGAFLCFSPSAATATTFLSNPGAEPGAPMVAIGPMAPQVNKDAASAKFAKDPDIQECLATVTKNAAGVPDHNAMDACLNQKEKERVAAQQAAEEAAQKAGQDGEEAESAP